MKLIPGLCISFLGLQSATAQQAAGQAGPPIYSVTAVARTTKAVNYGPGPTVVDFRGTLLLPASKGEATVEAHPGRTEIQVTLQGLTPPTKYGREYLTYTLWAITPEGAPRNLGEIIPGPSNKAKLRVTTDLQCFGMIVTAEPYASTRQPGDVVVMENEIRPDTVGKIETIDAKYELLPRGEYTWHVPDALEQAANDGPKVSMDKYQELLAIYEAQNALGIARAVNASSYAPNTIDKAAALLDEAHRLEGAGAGPAAVNQSARDAAQTAEDARVIAERRVQDERLAAAERDAARAQAEQQQALDQAQRARIAADAARAQSDADRAAREQAEASAAEARFRSDQAQARIAQPAVIAVPAPAPPAQPSPARAEVRMRLLEQLNGFLPTLDTPRGLVATVTGRSFHGVELGPADAPMVARLGSLVAAQPSLRIEVEAYSDMDRCEACLGRAESVRWLLIAQGVPASNVMASDKGRTRALVSNATPAGREKNRRVEIVVSGEAIGTLPYWDRTYRLTPR
jgi:flagellar motor protein MotB